MLYSSRSASLAYVRLNVPTADLLLFNSSRMHVRVDKSSVRMDAGMIEVPDGVSSIRPTGGVWRAAPVWPRGRTEKRATTECRWRSNCKQEDQFNLFPLCMYSPYRCSRLPPIAYVSFGSSIVYPRLNPLSSKRIGRFGEGFSWLLRVG